MICGKRDCNFYIPEASHFQYSFEMLSKDTLSKRQPGLLEETLLSSSTYTLGALTLKDSLKVNFSIIINHNIHQEWKCLGPG